MSIKALHWAFETVGLTPSQKIVLVALANYADEEGSCYPGQQRLAAMTGLSKSAVVPQLRSLEDAGLLQTEPRFRPNGGQTSNRYWLLLPGENQEGGSTSSRGEGTAAVGGPPHQQYPQEEPKRDTQERTTRRRAGRTTPKDTGPTPMGQYPADMQEEAEPEAEIKPIGTKERVHHPDSAMGLAIYFDDKVTAVWLKGSKGLLARNLSGWLRDGLTADRIRRMIDWYAADADDAEVKPKQPWSDFVGRRAFIFAATETEAKRAEGEAHVGDPEYWIGDGGPDPLADKGAEYWIGE